MRIILRSCRAHTLNTTDRLKLFGRESKSTKPMDILDRTDNSPIFDRTDNSPIDFSELQWSQTGRGSVDIVITMV